MVAIIIMDKNFLKILFLSFIGLQKTNFALIIGLPNIKYKKNKN